MTTEGKCNYLFLKESFYGKVIVEVFRKVEVTALKDIRKREIMRRKEGIRGR